MLRSKEKPKTLPPWLQIAEDSHAEWGGLPLEMFHIFETIDCELWNGNPHERYSAYSDSYGLSDLVELVERVKRFRTVQINAGFEARRVLLCYLRGTSPAALEAVRKALIKGLPCENTYSTLWEEG